MKTPNFLKDLPPWSKGVIAVAGVIALGFAGYHLYQLIKKKSSEEKADNALKKAAEDEIKDFEDKGMKLTYSDSAYPQYAETIYTNMNHCVGDNYSKVEETILKMKNDLDVITLVKAFGKRTDYCFGVPAGDYNLFAYVQKELGNENFGLTDWWKNRISNINKAWKKSGITYEL